MIQNIKEEYVNLFQKLNINNDINTKVLSLPERIDFLKGLIFPLTKQSIDQKGNSIQIWSIPESKPLAVLYLQDGSIRYIHKIINPLNPDDDLITLHNRLLSSSYGTWDYVTNEDSSLIIWPHLIARGWRDALPKSNQDLSGLTRLARGKTQAQMCTWFYTNGYRVTNADKSKIEIHIHGGGNAGTYSANDHQTIKNLLRQGGYIKAVHHDFPTSLKGL